jgi:ubiquinone/menaquinone biosynthesis C-methylase UbiE
MSTQAWVESGEAWTRWVRGPAAERYEPFTRALLDLIPPSPARVVDLGCGEGVFARELAARGFTVTGVDVAPAAVRHAAEADPDGTYVIGDMCALPFDDGSFDLAVARISFQDVENLGGAAAEAARVLAPGGSLCLSVFHPVCAAGRFDDERFVIDRYFDEGPW